MRFFSTTEAAAVLNVDPSRVRMLCKLGRIETIKVGNTYGIAEDVLEEFATQERRPGRPARTPRNRQSSILPVEPNVFSSNP